MARAAAVTWALIAGFLLAMSIVFGVVVGALALFPLVLNIWALVALGSNDVDSYFAERPAGTSPAGIRP